MPVSNQINKIVKCRVTGVSKFGAFVIFDKDKIGMIHISEMQDTYLDDVSAFLKVGDVVDALVLSVSDDGKYSLSMKPSKLGSNLEQVSIKEKNNNEEKVINSSSPGDFVWDNDEKKDQTFEEMMKKFKRTSEEKMSDLKRGENRGYSRKRGNR